MTQQRIEKRLRAHENIIGIMYQMDGRKSIDDLTDFLNSKKYKYVFRSWHLDLDTILWLKIYLSLFDDIEYYVEFLETTFFNFSDFLIEYNNQSREYGTIDNDVRFYIYKLV